MKKRILMLMMLVCMCFNLIGAKPISAIPQQDIAVEKTIDNNTTHSISKNHTNAVIIIAAIVYIVIAIVLVVYGIKGRIVVYRNLLDVSLCVALFAALPIVWIIFLAMFFLQVERSITLITLGIMVFIWMSVLSYIAI
ncbi:TPA: hypothetical protein SHD56_001333 [Campylobacter coli]|nr:hypothetical protein [Campylobacter coli]